MNKLALKSFPSKMGFLTSHNFAIRYRGFILLKQPNQTWLVRPERSPMFLLPFRTGACSISEVKQLLDKRLSEQEEFNQAA